jgi:hypothetical protein
MRENEIQVGKVYWAGRPGFESRVRVVRKAERACKNSCVS